MSKKADKNVSRRTFLTGTLGLLGAIFSAGVLYGLFSYLVPPSKKGVKEVVKVPISEVPPGGMKRFHIAGKPAAVVNAKEGYVAYSLVCSHLGCLVTWEGNKNEFLCPCHGARFDANGNVISGPPPKGLEPLEVQVQGTELLIS